MTPEWRDVSELRAWVVEHIAETPYGPREAILEQVDASRHLPARASKVLTEQEGGPPNERWEFQTAADALRQALEYERDGFPPVSSHIQDRLDRVQAEVDRLRAAGTTGGSWTCWMKTGFVTEERYCGKHGRAAGWPCSVAFPRDEAGASEGVEDYDLDSDDGDLIPEPPEPPVPDDVARRWLAERNEAWDELTSLRRKVTRLRVLGDRLAELLVGVGHRFPTDSSYREEIVLRWDAWRDATGEKR